MTSKTPTETREFLASLGLNPDAPALGQISTPVQNSPVVVTNVDNRTMPVTDIVFTEAMVEGFDLETNLVGASRHLFEIYKSVGKNKDRNSLLHRRVSEYLGGLRRERNTGGLVKERVKADKTTRDLAELLAATGITAESLAALLNQ